MLGNSLHDTTGNVVEIIDPGCHNLDSGPDFFNSKVKVNNTEWIGNVEIHVRASDWFKHGHHNDPAYDNVILHVVGVSDKEVRRTDGTLIPQVEITMPENFFRTLGRLSEDMDRLRCSSFLPTLPDINKTDWMETLTVERMQAKASHILDIFASVGNDWEQTCFVILCRAFGFGINGDPFEQLGRSLPLKYLSRHSDNLLQLEAMLFGQAGMLDSSLHILDDYYQTLCREYYFLARKYGLQPMKRGVWKYARTRPQNFPHRRIAYIAGFCENGFSLFTKIRENAFNLEKLQQLFDVSLKGYWKNHFSFDTDARNVSETLSKSTIDLLTINLVIPLIYAYSSRTGAYEDGEKALTLLTELPPENNTFVREFKGLGIKVNDAAASQAVIQLKKNYCDTRKCLYCRFGSYFLRVSSS